MVVVVPKRSMPRPMLIPSLARHDSGLSGHGGGGGVALGDLHPILLAPVKAPQTVRTVRHNPANESWQCHFHSELEDASNTIHPLRKSRPIIQLARFPCPGDKCIPTHGRWAYHATGLSYARFGILGTQIPGNAWFEASWNARDQQHFVVKVSLQCTSSAQTPKDGVHSFYASDPASKRTPSVSSIFPPVTDFLTHHCCYTPTPCSDNPCCIHILAVDHRPSRSSRPLRLHNDFPRDAWTTAKISKRAVLLPGVIAAHYSPISPSLTHLPCTPDTLAALSLDHYYAHGLHRLVVVSPRHISSSSRKHLRT